MSHKEYNVAYRDSHGNVAQVFTTPTYHAQAVKRQRKHPVAREWRPESEGGPVEHPTFIIERTISDWTPSE